MRKAFTLIEIIVTLVILSIVSYIASGLIAKTYIGYNQTNAIHKANIKLEIALTEIANRLEYAIDGTVVKRQGSSIAPIDIAPSNYATLEWVGYDKDGFEANDKKSGVDYNASNNASDKPAWSGFCNIAYTTTANQNIILTPGSDLPLAEDVIKHLSDDKANLTNGTVAIFFPGNYDYTNIGYKGSQPTGVRTVANFNSANSTLQLSSNASRITEHYKLAWSAYAVVPTNYNSAEKTYDLYLKYNFRPWNGQDYDSSGVKSALLVNNVTVFKTYATENRIHIKMCVKEKFGKTKNAIICKEKVVFK